MKRPAIKQTAPENRGNRSFFGVDATMAGMIAIADPVKSTTPAALNYLREHRHTIDHVDSDHPETAEAVGRQLNIQEIKAGVLPGQASYC